MKLNIEYRASGEKGAWEKGILEIPDYVPRPKMGGETIRVSAPHFPEEILQKWVNKEMRLFGGERIIFSS